MTESINDSVVVPVSKENPPHFTTSKGSLRLHRPKRIQVTQDFHFFFFMGEAFKVIEEDMISTA